MSEVFIVVRTPLWTEWRSPVIPAPQVRSQSVGQQDPVAKQSPELESGRVEVVREAGKTS